MDLHEACGVFGIYAPDEDIARLTYFALFALQHRGQESSGIATSDGKRIHLIANTGLVSQVFREEALLRLPGYIAIGHNRYSTTTSSNYSCSQPIVVDNGLHSIAVAHNGNITNSGLVTRELSEQGYPFLTASDAETIANLILSSTEKDWTSRIRQSMRKLQGAYSLTIMTPTALFGVRDPLGMRPLCLGHLGNGKWVISSESCALDHIGASFIREIEPGEIVMIDTDGLKSFKETSDKHALCIFEHIYFARPDSIINNCLLYEARQAMGASLAEEFPVEADLVIGVPDSATPAAVGYASRSGIPLGMGLVKNHYTGRTFIRPTQTLRDLGVKLKFNPMRKLLEGKRLVLIDDSIVRGTTTPQVIRLLRKSGAKEVHMRVCSPPISFPCFMGVDMASKQELIATHKNIEEIREFIDADSLGFLSLENLVRSTGQPKNQLCLACFTGDYPLPVQLELDSITG